MESCWRTHERPVADGEVLSQRVEGNVRPRTLAIVVRTRELGTRGRETTASDQRRRQAGTRGRDGVHLEMSLEIRPLARQCRIVECTFDALC